MRNRDPLAHNRALLETAEFALTMGRTALTGRLSTSELLNSGERLESLDTRARQASSRELVSRAIWRHVALGHAAGCVLKALWRTVPVDQLGRDEELGLPEFVSPLVDTATRLLDLFEAALVEWREELAGECWLAEAA